MTNCFQLFFLFTTLQTTFAQCVRLFWFAPLDPDADEDEDEDDDEEDEDEEDNEEDNENDETNDNDNGNDDNEAEEGDGTNTAASTPIKKRKKKIKKIPPPKEGIPNPSIIHPSFIGYYPRRPRDLFPTAPLNDSVPPVPRNALNVLSILNPTITPIERNPNEITPAMFGCVKIKSWNLVHYALY